MAPITLAWDQVLLMSGGMGLGEDDAVFSYSCSVGNPGRGKDRPWRGSYLVGSFRRASMKALVGLTYFLLDGGGAASSEHLPSGRN